MSELRGSTAGGTVHDVPAMPTFGQVWLRHGFDRAAAHARLKDMYERARQSPEFLIPTCPPILRSADLVIEICLLDNGHAEPCRRVALPRSVTDEMLAACGNIDERWRLEACR